MLYMSTICGRPTSSDMPNEKFELNELPENTRLHPLHGSKYVVGVFDEKKEKFIGWAVLEK